MSWNPRRQYTHICVQCQTVFHPEGREQRFCSRACSDAGHVLPRPLCEQCGEPRANRKHGARRFCGRACASLAATFREQQHCRVCGVTVSFGSETCVRHHHTIKRERRAKDCPQCGTTFIPYGSALTRGAGKYCSRACYLVVQNQRPAMLTVSCVACGKSFQRTKAAIERVERPTCSRACMAVANSGEGNTGWRGGNRAYRGPAWPTIAEAIRVRDGRRCRMCGKTEEQNGQRLAVDHVVPWRMFSSNDEANADTNLVSLCRSCHAKKTSHAERLYLKGDVLDFWRYQIAVAQPWAKA